MQIVSALFSKDCLNSWAYHGMGFFNLAQLYAVSAIRLNMHGILVR